MPQGALASYTFAADEPGEHRIGRSRGGLTCKVHLVADGRGRPRTRPEQVLADKGYPCKANRAWLADRGIKATIPDRADQHATRAARGSAGGRPPALDPPTHRGRNVVQRCLHNLKGRRGIAMRTDKTARSYHAAITGAAALIWLKNDLINTP